MRTPHRLHEFENPSDHVGRSHRPPHVEFPLKIDNASSSGPTERMNEVDLVVGDDGWVVLKATDKKRLLATLSDGTVHEEDARPSSPGERIVGDDGLEFVAGTDEGLDTHGGTNTLLEFGAGRTPVREDEVTGAAVAHDIGEPDTGKRFTKGLHRNVADPPQERY